MSFDVEAASQSSGSLEKDAKLPPRLRLLCIAPTEPSWVSLALQLDREGCHEPQFRWVNDSVSALAILRDEVFDCFLVGDVQFETASEQNGTARSRTVNLARSRATNLGDNDHSVITRTASFGGIAGLSAFQFRHREIVNLLRAIRASGYDAPTIFVANQLDDETWLKLDETQCAVFISSRQWNSRALVAVIKRELARAELVRENQQLRIAQHRRLTRERDEAEHLLDQQQQMIDHFKDVMPLSRADVGQEDSQLLHQTEPKIEPAPAVPIKLPAEIHEFYTELLRTYVIMGSGSLGSEIAQLAHLIATIGLSTRETLELHLTQVASLVQDLGNRSSRHVMARADLLALELMTHLGDCYHREVQKAG